MSNKYIETISKGSTYIPNNYLLDNRLLDGEKTLLSLLLASCFGDKVETYPSQLTLAQTLNKSVRTIQRYLKKLKELGYILVKRRGSISSVYRLLIKETMQKVNNVVNKAKNTYYNYRNKKQTNNNTYGYENKRSAEYYKQLLGWK